MIEQNKKLVFKIFAVFIILDAVELLYLGLTWLETTVHDDFLYMISSILLTIVIVAMTLGLLGYVIKIMKRA